MTCEVLQTLLAAVGGRRGLPKTMTPSSKLILKPERFHSMRIVAFTPRV